MIILVNPRATSPRNRRVPLSLLHLAAALADEVSWEIVDGNLPGVDVVCEVAKLVRLHRTDPVELVAVTVMPGPQLETAVAATREIRRQFPLLPIVWGGYFPSLYPEPVLAEESVDWLITGQGEVALAQLVEVIRGRIEPEQVAGLSFRDNGGVDRFVVRSEPIAPDCFPELPWHRLPMEEYLHPTVLGRRTGVYQSSIGCPHACSFCGVAGFWSRRQLCESPQRTEGQLRRLVEDWAMDSVHFYDSNFFLGEDRAIELAERVGRLGLMWWCEARIDTMLRFRESTWKALHRSGLRMAYFGAESGNDAVLARMNKNLTVDQIEEIAARTRSHAIVPEFSFCLGDPDDPTGDVEATLQLIRRLKHINPLTEIILYYYTPTPQPELSADTIRGAVSHPETLDGWLTPEWVNWSKHTEPGLPWVDENLRRRVQNFELVLNSRFPSLQDWRTPTWARPVLRAAAWWRWWRGDYSDARLLRVLRQRLRVATPASQAYGHLRTSQEKVL